MMVFLKNSDKGLEEVLVGQKLAVGCLWAVIRQETPVAAVI